MSERHRKPCPPRMRVIGCIVRVCHSTVMKQGILEVSCGLVAIGVWEKVVPFAGHVPM